MKVTKVSAQAQYSKGLVAEVNGSEQIVSWKKVSLGAEATLEGKELYPQGWKEAQKALYDQLRPNSRNSSLMAPRSL